MNIGMIVVTTCALTWNSGSTMPMRSPRAERHGSAPIAGVGEEVACVSIAPLGLPVVPEV